MSPKEAFSLNIQNEKNTEHIIRIRENIREAFARKITINEY